MGLTEKVAQRLAQLPTSQQREVLNFVEFLASRSQTPEQTASSSRQGDWNEAELRRLASLVWLADDEPVGYSSPDCREAV